MNILRRLFRREPAETRASPVMTWGRGGAMLPGGSYGAVDARLAENLSGVSACIGAISSAIASLPARVYRTTAAGRVELPDHPVARALRRPNSRQTGPDFFEMLLSECLLHGNGLAGIERDAAGEPIGLTPIPWRTVRPFILPSGRLAYDVTQPAGPVRRYLEGEVLHLRDRSDDGILGRSRISRAPAVLENATGLSDFASAVWENAATPSGSITVPTVLSQEAGEMLRESWTQRVAGARNARKIMILDGGMAWQSMSCSPEDAEVLASRRFSIEELCRLFQVPPPIVQDYTHGTFTNAQQAALWFAQLTLTPWCRKLEATVGAALFTDPTLHLEVDLSGLMRGDYATRWAANVAAVQAGILTIADVRTEEGYGPLPEANTSAD